ncbi:hypothetical protein DICPUDRAFT_158279 [Dictyostelium purpureum]|uniref:Thioesterase domain-containing protein n=1 Tax=Dictyostelium purpureum TaxID=5786 RepID=F1A190_DICPU|nr:uncharacterized protein DICPUDRAFT_158279 [Dictyostelium purpureum]EGC30040.1 hypothetical protein DICPUDRAFT_158279 [Dictyostelium purpureum]|eukprot:XP_003293427.1 hypothetical protein DICPUDRAFT_158279 [Dictyostelium purpureum]
MNNTNISCQNPATIDHFIHLMAKKGGGFDMKNIEGLKTKKVEYGYLELEILTTEQHTNYSRFYIHGAFQCFLFDITSVLSFKTTDPLEDYSYAITININTTLITPLPMGKRIRVVAKIEKKTSSMAFSNCSIMDEEGNVYSTASVILRIAKPSL